MFRLALGLLVAVIMILEPVKACCCGSSQGNFRPEAKYWAAGTAGEYCGSLGGEICMVRFNDFTLELQLHFVGLPPSL
jgi:hypothetical protein